MYYKPTVIDSRLIRTVGPCDQYSMRVVNNDAVAHTALDMEYETCYFKTDKHRLYSVTHTTRVQEIRITVRLASRSCRLTKVMATSGVFIASPDLSRETVELTWRSRRSL